MFERYASFAGWTAGSRTSSREVSKRYLPLQAQQGGGQVDTLKKCANLKRYFREGSTRCLVTVGFCGIARFSINYLYSMKLYNFNVNVIVMGLRSKM
jgi:hypothetical protein